jgi:hypothetical protein
MGGSTRLHVFVAGFAPLHSFFSAGRAGRAGRMGVREARVAVMSPRSIPEGNKVVQCIALIEKYDLNTVC